jgi:hypothetical protein
LRRDEVPAHLTTLQAFRVKSAKGVDHVFYRRKEKLFDFPAPSKTVNQNLNQLYFLLPFPPSEISCNQFEHLFRLSQPV